MSNDINEHHLAVYINNDLVYGAINIDIGAVRIDYDDRTYHLEPDDDDDSIYDDDGTFGIQPPDDDIAPHVDGAAVDLDRARNNYIDAKCAYDFGDDPAATLAPYHTAAYAFLAALRARRGATDAAGNEMTP
jgi:hypothetical protein